MPDDLTYPIPYYLAMLPDVGKVKPLMSPWV